MPLPSSLCLCFYSFSAFSRTPLPFRLCIFSLRSLPLNKQFPIPSPDFEFFQQYFEFREELEQNYSKRWSLICQKHKTKQLIVNVSACLPSSGHQLLLNFNGVDPFPWPKTRPSTHHHQCHLDHLSTHKLPSPTPQAPLYPPHLFLFTQSATYLIFTHPFC